jgi:arsenate reductase
MYAQLDIVGLTHMSLEITTAKKPGTHYNVLFLCNENSARSIMAEAILRARGGDRFTAHSAGSYPSGIVHSQALRQISDAGLSADGLRSKSWNEFSGPDAPHMDFVFTVCDTEAQEVCPEWPSKPLTANWGVPDPTISPDGSAESKRDFNSAYRHLERRISLFLSLPFASLNNMAIQREIDRIGKE